MAVKHEMSETDKLQLKITQLEGRIRELEHQVQQEQQSRRIAEAKKEGYAEAVKALGSRESDGRDVPSFPFPFYPFRRY